MGRPSRQRPISCQFCRVRKLRCSRQFPCSNCTSRGVPCREPQDPLPVPRPAVRKTSSPSSAETDILSRLERLESLLAVRNKEAETAAKQKEPVAASTGSSPVVVSTPSTSTPLPPKVQHLTADALFLERTCLGPKLADSVLSDDIVFRTCPIRLITQSSSYVFQNPNIPSASLSIEPTKCIWLPDREETRILIDKYVTEITFIHHVVHGPSLRRLVDEVYDSLDHNSQINTGAIFLLLSLCAHVTYSWTGQDDATRQLFSHHTEANSQAIFWAKASFDVLDYSQRNAHISLECVQGLCILSLVMSNLEGISSRSRSCIARAIVMSRELGLHRLDYTHNATSGQPTHLSGVKAEVGRRVWWYLVATDWMLGRFSGPPEGIYTIDPRHMVVRKPLNVNDEDLRDGEEPIDQPLDQPTCMSYFLQRLRIAEISRNFTDRIPLAVSNPDAVSYDLVMELDAEINNYMKEIPSFLLFDSEDWGKTPTPETRPTPMVIIQRHILNLFIYGQRCKLHLPYLTRGSVEPAFAYSREAALECARYILRIENQLEKEEIPFAATRLRLTIVLHSVFLASIVLLIDLCFGTGAADQAAKQQEMADAWRILEQAQAESLPAARLLELLKQVLKKHKVPLPVIRGRNRAVAKIGGQGDPLPLTPSSAVVSTNSSPFEQPFAGQEWGNPDSRMEFDSIDWDSIFWGLDAPFI